MNYNTDLSRLPVTSTQRIAIHVKPAAENALREGHPWLFEGSITKQNREGEPGTLAIIFDRKDRFLAVGLYDPNSPIRVKVLQHHKPAKINQPWFKSRLIAAIERRKPLLATQTTGYRLVHGENDGLPGLIIDRYADTLVLKIYTAAWLPHLRDILEALNTVFASENIVLRFSRDTQSQLTPDYGFHDGMVIAGNLTDKQVTFMENGLTFAANVIDGHKTGFFFDQRDNRLEVSKLSKGETVLDVFSYTGGFSVFAAHGGAKEVTSMDISKQALTAAQKNMQLNIRQTTIAAVHHQTLAQDAFDGLAQLAKQGKKFGFVIIDPPAFAKRQNEVEGALKAYASLAENAVDILEYGGKLMFASCSSRVSTDIFYSTVITTITSAGYDLDIIKQSSHTLDHPIGFPEGQYLKCLFATVRTVR